MSGKPLKFDAIRFEFVGYGVHADPGHPPVDRMHLDCGNALRPGVIDHHQLPAYSGSTAGLVVRHPELVFGAVRPDRNESDPFAIVLHQYPDLDCVVSAYLAICLLTDGLLPSAAEPLARYVDRVDAGNPGFTQRFPFSLYAAFMLLVHDTAMAGADGWDESIRKGLNVVKYVADCVARDGKPIPEVDAFSCEAVFRPRDRREIENDLARYRSKLANQNSSCRRMRLRLPSELGGSQEVDALLARDVQNINDPDRCVYFKDWARTDTKNAPMGTGFVALSVFASEHFNRNRTVSAQSRPDGPSGQSHSRCILSVTPSSGVSLIGLGDRLEQAESTRRMSLFGFDDRAIDSTTGAKLPNRPGYLSADPWYDGRGHNYTIVDSPRCGTVLTADEIETIFIQFGLRSQDEIEPLSLPSPVDESLMPDFAKPAPALLPKEKFRDDDGSRLPPENSITAAATLSRMSAVVDSWNTVHSHKAGSPKYPEIFISYSRRCIEWVEENITRPLAAARGEEAVFFDKHCLNAGMSWMAELADNVMHCRLFVPAYCEAYFRSEFCQWELQLALSRDPTGNKRIIAPIMLEPVEMPAYCRLIQAQTVEGENFSRRFVALVQSILD